MGWWAGIGGREGREGGVALRDRRGVGGGGVSGRNNRKWESEGKCLWRERGIVAKQITETDKGRNGDIYRAARE